MDAKRKLRCSNATADSDDTTTEASRPKGPIPKIVRASREILRRSARIGIPPLQNSALQYMLLLSMPI